MEENKRNNLLFFTRRTIAEETPVAERSEKEGLEEICDLWFDGTGALKFPSSPATTTRTFLRVLTGGMSEKIVRLDILRARRERLEPKLSLLTTLPKGI